MSKRGGKANSASQSLEGDLRALGFTEYEAKAYLVLLKSGPATAYEVSKSTGMPRANAYGVLEGLAGKKVVNPVSKAPVRYVAVKPERLLDGIVRKTQERCERLSEALTALAGPDSQGDDHVWTVNGHEELVDKMNQMVEAARQHIWIKTSETLLEPFRESLSRASHRGVQVLIILFGEHPERFRLGPGAKVYLHEGNGVPVGNANQLITVTRDFEEAIVGYVGEVSYAAHTRSRPVVLLADTLIRHEIYFAEIFKHFGEDIQRKFGPAIIKLRRSYLPPDQAQLWAHMVKQRS